MAVLQRHDTGDIPAKPFTIRLAEDKYNILTDYAFSNRMTLTAAVARLLDAALFDNYASDGERGNAPARRTPDESP